MYGFAGRWAGARRCAPTWGVGRVTPGGLGGLSLQGSAALCGSGTPPEAGMGPTPTTLIPKEPNKEQLEPLQTKRPKTQRNKNTQPPTQAAKTPADV